MNMMRRQKFIVGGLWAAFALTLVCGGLLLLIACEVRIEPFLRLRFCPTPLDRSAFEREADRRHELENRLHEAELILARIAPCETVAPPPSVVPAPPPPAPAPPPARAEVPTPPPPKVGKPGRLDVVLWWKDRKSTRLNSSH